VESLFGPKVLLAVYIIGGIQGISFTYTGNMLFDIKNVITNTHGRVAVGSSTSICAILGLYIVNALILHFKGTDVKEFRKKIVYTLVTLLLICLIPGVDVFSHMGSLISGFFLGLVLVA
jgi:membrane associated rhomboid family serine protease